MKFQDRPLTALERRNVEEVSRLLAEIDRLRDRLANAHLTIIVLCMAMIGACLFMEFN